MVCPPFVILDINVCQPVDSKARVILRWARTWLQSRGTTHSVKYASRIYKQATFLEKGRNQKVFQLMPTRISTASLEVENLLKEKEEVQPSASLQQPTRSRKFHIKLQFAKKKKVHLPCILLKRMPKGTRLQRHPSLLRIKHGIWRSSSVVLYIRHLYSICNVRSTANSEVTVRICTN